VLFLYIISAILHWRRSAEFQNRRAYWGNDTALTSPSDKHSITLQFLVTSTLMYQRRMEKRAILSLEKNVLYLQTLISCNLSAEYSERFVLIKGQTHQSTLYW